MPNQARASRGNALVSITAGSQDASASCETWSPRCHNSEARVVVADAAGSYNPIIAATAAKASSLSDNGGPRDIILCPNPPAKTPPTSVIRGYVAIASSRVNGVLAIARPRIYGGVPADD
jgi:hypothetical protein